MGGIDKPSAESPTRVRWRILVLLLAYSFMSWFNRASMASAGDERIMPKYGISTEAMGAVYSAFLFVYAIFMTPGGWFIDRFGARLALVVMGFGSGLFGALTGSAVLCGAGLLVPALLAIRGVMGLFSAPIYPACGRVVSRWIPYPQRALANGMVTCAAPVGIACTFVVFGALMDAVDWPSAFAITGGVTAVLAVLWTVTATDHPEQHAAVNTGELRLITQDEPAWSSAGQPGSAAKGSGTGWSALLGNRSLVWLTVSYGAVNYFEYLFTFWTHHYFDEVLHMGKVESRYYYGVVLLAQAAGMVLGGWLSDRLQRHYGYKRGRALVPVGGMLASAVFLAIGLAAAQPGWVVVWFALANAAVGMCEGPFWATAIELGGARGGTSAGICNTGGNAGGLVAPVVTPAVSRLLGWQWGIGLGSVVCLLGAALWWWIDPAERCQDGSEPGWWQPLPPENWRR
jgi:MFS family permease